MKLIRKDSEEIQTGRPEATDEIDLLDLFFLEEGLIESGKTPGRDETIVLAPFEERTLDGYCDFVVTEGSMDLSSSVPWIDLLIKENRYISTPRFKAKARENGCMFTLKTAEPQIEYLD